MLGNLLLASLLVLMTSMQPQKKSTINLPIPIEYQGAAEVMVDHKQYFWEVEEACGDKDPEWITYACYDPGKRKMIMPNPCSYPEAKTVGTYAHLACHEKAHRNGWEH
jgi:hypothetical protein